MKARWNFAREMAVEAMQRLLDGVPERWRDTDLAWWPASASDMWAKPEPSGPETLPAQTAVPGEFGEGAVPARSKSARARCPWGCPWRGARQAACAAPTARPQPSSGYGWPAVEAGRPLSRGA